jgi:hypothetical protein
MLSTGMQGMVKALATVAGSGETTLILTRSTTEMVAVAKFVDRMLKRVQCFTRISYDDGDRFLFTLSFMVEEDEELADIWVASIYDASPDSLEAFTDGQDAAEHVAWPDEAGIYTSLPYATWKDTWGPFGDERGPLHERPLFRPADLFYALRFDVGKPEGWTPLSQRVSVYEHLRRNLSIDMNMKHKKGGD